MNTEKIIKLINNLNIAIAKLSLYSERHDAVSSLTDECMTIMDHLFREGERLQIMRIGNDLIVNDMPIKVKSIHINNFIKLLKRRGLERIDITNGITKEEVYGLIVDLAKHKGNQLKQSPHISSGKVQIMLHQKMIEEDSRENKAILTQQIINVEEVMQDAQYFKHINVAGLEDVVINFIAIFRRESNILNILTPFKAHSEHTYTHATNVSILTIFQAEYLGITGEALHDIGVSALLHDVGKIRVSKEILYKKSKLDEQEWNEIQQHTIYGAKYLFSLNDVPQLAPIVAFEHHMKFDGTGYPIIPHINKRQHIISQIVAISDFYDALRQKRPYKKGFSDQRIFELMYEGANKEFNPLLLNNFIKNMSKTSKNMSGISLA